MSKMQMLVFATGMAVIGILFLNFISGIELKSVAENNIIDVEKIINERLSSENLCSSNSLVVPDVLYYGLGGNSRLFYDLIFSKVSFSDHNLLVISISEHGKNRILSSRKIPIKGSIVFVKPDFLIGENYSDFGSFYNVSDEIILYPRATYTGKQVAPPNSFIALKEVNNGQVTLYVVPCSSLLNPVKDSGLTSNCTSNLLLVGCYKLKMQNPNNNSTVSNCLSLAITSGSGVTQSEEVTWDDCKRLFNGIG